MRKYNTSDVGCFGDGAFGLSHIRHNLALLVRSYDGPAHIADALYSDDDDASDAAEYAALDWLNENACEESVYFDLDGGDLLLLEVEADA